MRLYQALARELAARRANPVFSLMGEDLVKLVADLVATHGVSNIAARHESGAVAMADGYSRVCGRVGVGIVSRGPGFTNSLTATVAASRGWGRVLVLVGEPAASGATDAKVIDQQGVLSALGLRTRVVTRLEATLEELDAAWRAAEEGGVVVLRIPIDFLDRDASNLARPRWVEARPTSPADPAEISAVADIVASSERPLIVAGRGASRPGTRDVLEAIGDRIGALLGTSLLGKGFFSGAPFDVGVCGAFAAPRTVRLGADVDCVLAFGASLNAATTRGQTMFPRARVVHFELSSKRRASIPVEMLVVGDAPCGARALLGELDRRGTRRVGYRTPQVEELLRADPWEESTPDDARGGLIDPRQLMLRLEKLLPSDRAVVSDGGHAGGFPTMYLSTPAPELFIYTQDYNSIGLGLGSAIGAALASPNRLTMLGIGDGALMMSLGELEAAARHAVPLLVVVINDAAYGAEVHLLRAAGLPCGSAVFGSPDIESTAKGLGCDAFTARDLSDLDVLPKLLSVRRTRPLVVDCRVNPDVCAEWMSDAVALGLSAPLAG